MKTEINGDWKAYSKRFGLPPRKVILGPLKNFGICFAVQCIACALACVTHVLILFVSSLIIGAVLYAVYKYFWEVVLEESKGLWADTLMWIYYLLLSAITLLIPFLIALPYLNV